MVNRSRFPPKTKRTLGACTACVFPDKIVVAKYMVCFFVIIVWHSYVSVSSTLNPKASNTLQVIMRNNHPIGSTLLQGWRFYFQTLKNPETLKGPKPENSNTLKSVKILKNNAKEHSKQCDQWLDRPFFGSAFKHKRNLMKPKRATTLKNPM